MAVKLHSFVNDVVIEDDRIQCVIIQSKQGPLAIKAGAVIDATGDGDVAFSAGIPFEQGRDKDGLCQPGTANLRIAGVDVEKFSGEPDKLKLLWNKFLDDYRHRPSQAAGSACGKVNPGRHYILSELFLRLWNRSHQPRRFNPG